MAKNTFCSFCHLHNQHYPRGGALVYMNAASNNIISFFWLVFCNCVTSFCQLMIISAVCQNPVLLLLHQSERWLSVKSKCVDALNHPERASSFSSPVRVKRPEQPSEGFSASSFVLVWKVHPVLKLNNRFCSFHLLISSAAARLDVTSCVSSSPGSFEGILQQSPPAFVTKPTGHQQPRSRWCQVWSEDCQLMLVH